MSQSYYYLERTCLNFHLLHLLSNTGNFRSRFMTCFKVKFHVYMCVCTYSFTTFWIMSLIIHEENRWTDLSIYFFMFSVKQWPRCDHNTLFYDFHWLSYGLHGLQWVHVYNENGQVVSTYILSFTQREEKKKRILGWASGWHCYRTN